MVVLEVEVYGNEGGRWNPTEFIHIYLLKLGGIVEFYAVPLY